MNAHIAPEDASETTNKDADKLLASLRLSLLLCFTLIVPLSWRLLTSIANLFPDSLLWLMSVREPIVSFFGLSFLLFYPICIAGLMAVVGYFFSPCHASSVSWAKWFRSVLNFLLPAFLVLFIFGAFNSP